MFGTCEKNEHLALKEVSFVLSSVHVKRMNTWSLKSFVLSSVHIKRMNTWSLKEMSFVLSSVHVKRMSTWSLKEVSRALFANTFPMSADTL